MQSLGDPPSQSWSWTAPGKLWIAVGEPVPGRTVPAKTFASSCPVHCSRYSAATDEVFTSVWKYLTIKSTDSCSQIAWLGCPQLVRLSARGEERAASCPSRSEPARDQMSCTTAKHVRKTSQEKISHAAATALFTRDALLRSAVQI